MWENQCNINALWKKIYSVLICSLFVICFNFFSDYYDVFFVQLLMKIYIFFCAADYEAVVKLSDGFNGADLRNVCTEAGSAFSPLRSPELDHSSLYFSNFSLHCYDVQGWFCCFFSLHVFLKGWFAVFFSLHVFLRNVCDSCRKRLRYRGGLHESCT